MIRTDVRTVLSFDELHPPLGVGELLHDPPEDWSAAWQAADPHRF